MNPQDLHEQAAGREPERPGSRPDDPPGIARSRYAEALRDYGSTDSAFPLLLHGDALHILRQLPDESFDCAMTSPPYWGKRQYEGGGIGLEAHHGDYVRSVTRVFAELKRVLKPMGSFWLNIGDSYRAKALLGLPWRVAIELTDNQGWILRNSIIWNKVKSGMDTSADRLGNVHENLFHFVKQPSYYYDVDSIRTPPGKAKVVNGAVVSATGVSGVRYRRQIELSTMLTDQEKRAAASALDGMLKDIARGRLADFRMIIRGQQRTTHSDQEQVSGRAKELRDKGFYFLRYHPKGSKPSDVWDIIPEDTQNRRLHFAPYPQDLCRIPILASCPADGLVLDPFAGTGTTTLVARDLGRKSVGIDVSEEYLLMALDRHWTLL